MQRLSTEEFVARAKKVHGDTYDYSETHYASSTEKLRVVCREHGAFYQSPQGHLAGYGCRKCGVTKVAGQLRLSQEQFLSAVRAVHGEVYILDRTSYAGRVNRVEVDCRVHGHFLISANSLLSGHGCSKCAVAGRANERRKTTELFIAESQARFGDKFDYRDAEYVSRSTKLKLFCSCGAGFLVSPSVHLSGSGGCPDCFKQSVAERTLIPFDVFVTRARQVHGEKYLYVEETYRGVQNKVSIVCGEHGVFVQAAFSHLAGRGCKKCGIATRAGNRLTRGSVAASRRLAELSEEPRNARYSYDKAVYAGHEGLITITCKEHGEFSQSYGNHVRGAGCPKCAKERASEILRFSFDDFLTRATKTHGARYSYDRAGFASLQDKLRIVCRKHGEFLQRGADHLQGKGCRKCAVLVSRAEGEIVEFVQQLGLDPKSSVKGALGGRRELDIVIDPASVAVELNGLYWHSERTGRGRHYHQSKTDAAAKAGYSLIHITDLQWETRKEAVKSMLMARCGVEMEKFDARKCLIVSPSVQEMREFLERSHIQGFRPSKEHYGLSYGDKLVAVASFGLSKAREAELQRYATLPGMRVRGGLGRLVAHWRRLHEGTDLISFCDTTYFDGRSYRAVGFVQEKILGPDYSYTDGISCYSKEAFRKAHLAERFDNYDRALTEKENAENNGWYRIWGCNKLKFRLPALVKFPN